MESIDFHNLISDHNITANLNNLRESSPIAWCDQGFWLLTRYDHCLSLIKRTGTFSENVTSDVTQMSRYDDLKPYGDYTSAEQWVRRKLLYTDPPIHPALRKPVQAQFTRRALDQSIIHMVHDICQSTLAAIADRDHFDVVNDFAIPYAVGVAASLLGLPQTDTVQIYEWLTEMAKVDNTPLLMTTAQVDAASGAITQLRRYITDIIKSTPDHTDRSALLILNRQFDASATDEIETFIDRALELLAGTGSVIGTIVTSFAALADAPSEWTKLKHGSVSPQAAVEELLRYTSVASSACRVVTKDFSIDGTTFKSGEIIELALRSANRDPRVFSDPDTLSLDRNPNPHLTFGDGRHRCLGEHLMRIELQVAVEGLVNAYDIIATPDGGPTRIEDRFGILGFKCLNARVTRNT